MTDLAAFLLAQIADDEAAARAAGEAAHDGLDGRWTYWPGTDKLSEQHDHPDGFVRWHSNIPPGEREESAPIVTYWQEDAAHIVRHDPARVLAEVAAKQAIVELHESDHPYIDISPPRCQYCGDEYPCMTLRLLAQPYADRPGWDPAWKVET